MNIVFHIAHVVLYLNVIYYIINPYIKNFRRLSVSKYKDGYFFITINLIRDIVYFCILTFSFLSSPFLWMFGFVSIFCMHKIIWYTPSRNTYEHADGFTYVSIERLYSTILLWSFILFQVITVVKFHH